MKVPERLIKGPESTLLYFLDDPAVVVSAKGRLAYANPPFRTRFRLTRESLAAKPAEKVLPAWFARAITENLADMRIDSGPRTFWVSDRRSHFRVVMKTIEDGRRMLGALVTLHEESNHNLSRLNVELFRSMLEDVLYPMEEIKAVLTRDTVAEAALRGARSQVKFLEEGLVRFSSFGEVFFGSVRPEKVPFSAGRLISLAWKSLRPVAEQQGVTLIDGSAREIPSLLGDPALINRVLGLMVDYAVKITPKGEMVVVSADLLMASDGTPRLIYSISGTGIVSPDLDFHNEARMLESLIGLPDDKKRLMLRLILAKRLISAMRGEVAAAAHERAGMTLSIVMPTEIHFQAGG